MSKINQKYCSKMIKFNNAKIAKQCLIAVSKRTGVVFSVFAYCKKYFYFCEIPKNSKDLRYLPRYMVEREKFYDIFKFINE